MSADALARGDVVTATRLGQQAQAQEKASGFRREALQRELGFANAILLRSVERLRRARIDQFEGQGLEVRGKAIGEQSRRKLETARELEKKTR